MEQPLLMIHIVDSDSRSRAEQARTAFALGHHSEVYSDLAELLARPPAGGIILLRERETPVALADLFDRFGERGVWLPVIVCAENPAIERVVAAVKDGALDYLELPLEIGRLARSLARVVAEDDEHGRARWQLTEARRRVASLSEREREVLELLTLGSSNKIIAREPAISPRTVEIHRANMMSKLRAGHAAEAVRLWLQSGLEIRVAVPSHEHGFDRDSPSAYPGFVRMLRGRPPEAGDDEREGQRSSRRTGSA